MKPLEGLKINFFGDSITEGYSASNPKETSYVPVFAQRTGAVVRNYGVAATRIARQDGDENLNFCARMGNMDDDADVVVVLGGVNDFGHGTAKLGDNADRTPDTFYGALHTLYSLLKNKYPAALIVVCTPLACASAENVNGYYDGLKPAIAPEKTYADIIRDVAAQYDLPVLDLFRDSFLQPAIPAICEAYFADGLHPNDAGHSVLADEIADFLCKLIAPQELTRERIETMLAENEKVPQTKIKRSRVNEILRENLAFIRQQNFNLPPFAFFTPEEWKEKGHEYDEIRSHMLGWDITDYGRGEFDKIGLFLFTIRNGSLKDPACKKMYAEKLLISDENQYSPMHFHFHKMEDIINRGGGNLIIELFNSTEDNELADTPVTVTCDGRVFTVPAGTRLCLKPGESITLPPRQYHAFWAEAGHGKVLIGEVSMVNDDNTDNYFYERMGRFPEIEEDEEPLYLLCNEYPEVAK